MKCLVFPLFIAAMLAACNVAAMSQTTSAHTPAVNSTERQSILDALRAGSDDRTVVYQVHFIRVHDGWAWVDTTPLNAKTRQPIAEGGPNLLHIVNGKWQVMDLSKVAEDPNDPLGPEDASPRFVKNLRRTYKGCPADIFPKPSN